MFGYACNETDVLMPAPIYYSHKILELMAIDRKRYRKEFRTRFKKRSYDEHENGKPSKVTSVLLNILQMLINLKSKKLLDLI